MIQVVRCVWRWSWIPALAIVVLFGIWIDGVLVHFRQFGIVVDAAPFRIEFTDVARRSLQHAQRRWTTSRLADEQLRRLGVQRLGLEIAPHDLRTLDSDLPYSGRGFVAGTLASAAGNQTIEVRYRGDTYAHWGRPKKSFRIRTAAAEPFKGRRTFNLIAPKHAEQLNNWLSYRLAHHLGLLAPHAELVALDLNGAFHGLYVLTEQVDEDTLRQHDRLPGDIYVGELLLRDAWTGVPNRLFARAGLWEKVAEDHRTAPGDRAPLAELVRRLNQPADTASSRALLELLDLEMFARFAVLEMLTQSAHFDHFHNWRLYWDPWRRTFEPIVWDPVGWITDGRSASALPIELFGVASPLQGRLHDVAEFQIARQVVLREFLTGPQLEAFLRDLDHGVDCVRTIAPSDPNLHPADDAAALRAVDDFAAYVRQTIAESRTRLLEAPGEVRWRHLRADSTVRIAAKSAAPMGPLILRFDAPLELERVELHLARAERVEAIDVSERCSVADSTVTVDMRLVCDLERVFGSHERRSAIHNTGRRPGTTTFELVSPGFAHARLLAVEIAGCEVVPSIDLPAGAARHVSYVSRPRPQTIENWAGSKRFAPGVHRFDGPVVIAPGTELQLAPDTSLEFRATLTALGTDGEPIRVVREVAPARSPGAFSLFGAGAAGSRLRHCEFLGSSSERGSRADPGAMFSIHSVDDVTIVDCRFAEAVSTETAIHVVHSRVDFERVVIAGAPRDGLDCDISRVTLLDCAITGCGHAGIDLMRSEAWIRGGRSTDHAGSGLSIGARSSAVLIGCAIERCTRAIEVADASHAALLHCGLTHNYTACALLRADRRYADGGHARLVRCTLRHNRDPATIDDASSLVLTDCGLDSTELPGALLEDCDAGDESRRSSVGFPTVVQRAFGDRVAEWTRSFDAVRGPPDR